MNNISKTFYGGIFLDKVDLKEFKRKNRRVELEYYSTENNINELGLQPMQYGIEVVKKEYCRRKINIESQRIENITNNNIVIDGLLNILKKHKVTPTGLNDVITELLKEQITE